MDPWILFDDGHPGLAPLCDLRASFELRTGALTTLERITQQIGCPPAALFVPEPLRELVASRHPQPINELPPGDRFVCVHGRSTSLHDAAIAEPISRGRAQELLGAGRLEGEERAELLTRPWHVLTHCERNLPDDLSRFGGRLERLRPDASRCIVIVGDEPVLIGRGVTVHPHVVFDTSAGPVVLDERATVRSMSVVVGPGYIGQDSIVVNHAHVRAGTVIGPHCKVGGEVNGCIFQGYSNKAHSGYLGNSFVGEWVNLGADTVTSNLKNTYGQVRMQTDPDGEPESTGMQFLGSIIGDHVKTAIGTRLLTGTCIHTGAMLATSGFPSKCVRRFAFLTDEGEKRYDLDRFLQVAEAVMRRREMNVSDSLRRRLANLYACP